MSGDYLFPKRRLRSVGDVLDANEVNQVLQPAAERLNGELNQHNIRAPLSGLRAPFSPGAFVSAQENSVFVGSGIDFEQPPYGGPSSGTSWADRFDLFPTLSWSRVTNDGASSDADAAIQLTTGRSMLSLRAALWYSYHANAAGVLSTVGRWAKEGFAGTLQTMPSLDSAAVTAAKLNYPAGVQFAFRLDGVVLSETITGRVDVEQRPFFPRRVVSPRSKTGRENAAPAVVKVDENMSGPTTPRLASRVEGVNFTVCPIRLGFHVLVEPGDHLVELVARRCSQGARAVVDSFISVYSRQLAVFSFPLDAAYGSDSDNFMTVRAVDPETTFSKSEVSSQRLDLVAAASNEISPGQVSRGSLNRFHLSGRSLVVGTAIGIDGVPSSQSGLTVTALNGGSSRTFTATSTSGIKYSPLPTPLNPTSIAWSPTYTLVALPSTFLILNKCSTSLATTTTNQFLTVLGNVALSELHFLQTASGPRGPGATEMTAACAFACFGLAYSLNGEWYAHRESAVFVNSANYMSYDTAITSAATGLRSHEVEVEIPLMSVFDLSQELATIEPGHIGIFCALVDVAKNGTKLIEATVRRSSIQAFGLLSGG